MVSCDNRQWILSLIQNAYVTSDDTGLCEEILQSDEGRKNVMEFPFFAQDDHDLIPHLNDPELHSPDISADRDRTRYRTSTEEKKEKIKEQQEKASRTKRFTWKHDPSVKIDDTELSEMFRRKTSFCRSSDTSDGEPPPPSSFPVKSLLAHLLTSSEHMNTNAFIDYSKYDGVTHNNVATKQINIFLHVGPNPCLDYPLRVCVICSAKVSDLIGLICWIYTKENREPSLKTIDYYQLYIAEEDGQYDAEFMPLEKGTCVEKYRFETLAMVEKDVPEISEGILITVNFADGAFSKIEVSSTDDITLKEILNKSISRRKEIGKMKEAGVDYHLEREDEPGVALKLDKTLSQVKCTEFAAVRDNSKRMNDANVASPNVVDMNVPQTFNVDWVQKFAKYGARIEISCDKFEIVPSKARTGGGILPSRAPAPLSFGASQLIDCHTKGTKKDRIELLLTIRGEDSFKNFKFQCAPHVANALTNKCKFVIKWNSRNVSKTALTKPYFRRHDSLTFRKKAKNDSYPFEI